MGLDVLSSSSSPSPSVLLETLLIPESTGLLLNDSVDDVTGGGVCIQAGADAEAAAASGCEQKECSSEWKL